MVALWVVYCLGVSSLLVAAAAAGERILHSKRWPIRWTWAFAIFGSLALPAWSLVASNSLEPRFYDGVESQVGAFALSAEPGVVASRTQARDVSPAEKSLPERAGTAATRVLWAASPLLSALWLAGSISMAIVLLGGWLRIRRKRALWRTALVGDRRVMISRRTGPAVVGFFHPDIVLPAWALELAEGRRELVLLHEEEHLRAHDERLLLIAGIALIPMPWNIAMWYQLRRLRLAVEIDCDARVLRRRPDALEYGDLLLDVGRRVNSGALQMAALSEPVSFLAKRISAMVAVHRQSRTGAAVTLALAAAALAMACQAPRPPAPRLLSDEPTASSPRADRARPDRSPDSTVVWNAERMTRDSLVRRVWGKTLVATEPAALEFVVDANDVVVSAGIRTGVMGYSAPDSSVTSMRFTTGHSDLSPVEVASIEVNRSVEFASGITSVMWVRLKEGVDLERRGSRRGEAREAAISNEQRRVARTTATRLDMLPQHAVATGGSPVDPHYRLRPGDKLLLTLTGGVEQAHRLEVSRSGFIVIPQVGYVSVTNLTLALLDEVLYSRLAMVYPGLGQGPAATTRYFITVEREATTPEAALAGRNRPSAAALDASRGRPRARSGESPSDSIMRAAARKLYPDLLNHPPESPVTLWFLADTADQVVQTRAVRSRLGTVGMREVLGAFPNLIERQIRSWTVTAARPFAIVWVRAAP